LMIENEALISQLKVLFGEKTYYKNGKLNRKYLSNIVFNDQDKLAALNAIVHPAIAQDSIDWHHAQTDVPYTLKEAAILFESGSHLELDKTITVFAPAEIRIERVMMRDKVDRTAILARMNKQMPESEKIKMADYVIYNDGTLLLADQVKTIHLAISNSSKDS